MKIPFDWPSAVAAVLTQRKLASVAAGLVLGMLFDRDVPDQSNNLLALLDWATAGQPWAVVIALLGASAWGSIAQKKPAKPPDGGGA